jgi:hypothetical protein
LKKDQRGVNVIALLIGTSGLFITIILSIVLPNTLYEYLATSAYEWQAGYKLDRGSQGRLGFLKQCRSITECSCIFRHQLLIWWAEDRDEDEPKLLSAQCMNISILALKLNIIIKWFFA